MANTKFNATVEYSTGEAQRYYFQCAADNPGLVCIWDKRGVLGFWKIERYNGGKLGREWIRQIIASEFGGKIIKW